MFTVVDVLGTLLDGSLLRSVVGLRVAQPVMIKLTAMSGKAKVLIAFMFISLKLKIDYLGAQAGSRTSPCSLGKFMRKRPSVDMIESKPRLFSRVAYTTI